MENEGALESELPVLELVDGTAEDRSPVPQAGSEMTSLSWQLGSDAVVFKHRRLLLVVSSLVFLVDASLYAAPAPVVGQFLDGNQTHVDALYGLIFAAGPAVSLIVMPLSTSCAACTGPMEILFPAFGALAASSTLLGVAGGLATRARRSAMLIGARALSGVGTGLARSAVPAVIASAHGSDEQRNAALSSALLGLGLGETLSPALSGGLAAAGVDRGWKITFFALSGTAVLGCVMVLVAQRRLSREGVRLRVTRDHRESSLRLLRDKPTLVICGASLLAESAVSLIPSVVVPWLHAMFISPPAWQIGLLLMAPNLSYLAITPVLVLCHVPQTRTRLTLAGASLLTMSLSLCTLPFVPSIGLPLILLPMSGLGVGAAVLDLCLLPVLSGRLVARYSVKQNAVYKVQNFTLALAFTIGPLVGSSLVGPIGYDWTFFTFSMALLVCLPFLCFLKTAEEPCCGGGGYTLLKENSELSW